MQEWQEKIEHRLEKLEQRTDEIRAVRVEVASEDVTNRLKTLEDDTAVLKIEMQGARADISNVKATQSDHSAFFIEHGNRLSAIETKQDTHSELLGQLITIGEATKNDITSIKTTQEQILQLLQQKQGE
jgi:hypothetical protein